VGAELFDVDRRTDGWTDMTKLLVAFRDYANMPKKRTFHSTLKELELFKGWLYSFIKIFCLK
jgi:hypothetical protein